MPDTPTNVGSLNPPLSSTSPTPSQTPSTAAPVTPPPTQTPAPPSSPVGTLSATSAPKSPTPPATSDASKPPVPIPQAPPQPQVVDTSSGARILFKDGVPIEAKPSTPQIVAVAGAVQLKSDGSKLIAEPVVVNPQNPTSASDFVKIEPNPDGVLGAKFRGVCLRCGFQSYQPAEILARQMIEYHAARHLLGR